jgi:hypothetical protein
MTDWKIAKKYLAKRENAKNSNIPFSLSFVAFKNIMLANKCKYSGIKLTDGDGKKFTDRTIDRIDNRKGYISGNCVASCSGINKFKSYIENPVHPLTLDSIKNIVKSMECINEETTNNS